MKNLTDMLSELIKTPIGISVPIPEVPGDWKLVWYGWKPYEGNFSSPGFTLQSSTWEATRGDGEKRSITNSVDVEADQKFMDECKMSGLEKLINTVLDIGDIGYGKKYRVPITQFTWDRMHPHDRSLDVFRIVPNPSWVPE